MGSAVSPAAHRILCVRFEHIVRPFKVSRRAHFDFERVASICLTTSFAFATLDTGGWLGLTRRGLAPRKRRQASPGAPPPIYYGHHHRRDLGRLPCPPRGEGRGAAVTGAEGGRNLRRSPSWVRRAFQFGEDERKKLYTRGRFIPTTSLREPPRGEARTSFYVTCGLDGFGSVSMLPVRLTFQVCAASLVR